MKIVAFLSGMLLFVSTAFAAGSSMVYSVDGQEYEGDDRRVRGIHANAAIRTDPYLGNTSLVDQVGGSAVDRQRCADANAGNQFANIDA